MKQLNTIIKQELLENESIWINKKSQDTTDEWWKFEEFKTKEDVLNKYDKKVKVIKYWHEDGLCIILNK